MWGLGWTMEGGGALSGIDEAVQRLQNMKDEDAWMTRAAGAKMLCTCQSCYSSKTFCQQHFGIFWIPSLCALVSGFITHRYPRFLYIYICVCYMFYLSDYQIVTSLMRQGLRGVPSLTNRKMGFGGPSPHRVFQHHQPNVANLEARSVAECLWCCAMK